MERKEAIELGLKTYETGRVCRNGHLSYRYASTGSCATCVNGENLKDKPETFSNMAASLSITALKIYNDEMKRISANYEQAMLRVKYLEEKAADAHAAITMRQSEVQSKAKERELHSNSLRRMVKSSVFIHPKDVIEIKNYILQLAQTVCSTLSIFDTETKRQVRGDVLHEIRCFPEHREQIINHTNQVYNNRLKGA